MKNKAYLYGVLLGDGFYSKNKKGNYEYVMLKTIDKDFAEKFQEVVENIIGKKYSVYSCKPSKPKEKPFYICKCYASELVKESMELTKNKTEIPNFVKDGDSEIKKSFLQGIMDSEGWVSFTASSLGRWNASISFGVTSSWSKDAWYMFRELGIGVSKFYRRNFRKENRKDLLWFTIDILDYVNSGLTFNIRRKRERLEYIAQILRDYTHRYKHSYRNDVQDIVQPVAKAVGY